jgi:hypothetical protein
MMDDASRRKPGSDGARPGPVVSAVLEQIDREMDEAFGWNVTRNREIQITLQRLREAKPNASSEERGRIIEAITARYRMFARKARSDGRKSVM